MNKNLANYIWFIVLGFCLMSLSKCMWRSNHSEINKSDKEQFYKTYETWDESFQDWVVETISNNI